MPSIFTAVKSGPTNMGGRVRISTFTSLLTIPLYSGTGRDCITFQCYEEFKANQHICHLKTTTGLKRAPSGKLLNKLIQCLKRFLKISEPNGIRPKLRVDGLIQLFRLDRHQIIAATTKTMETSKDSCVLARPTCEPSTKSSRLGDRTLLNHKEHYARLYLQICLNIPKLCFYHCPYCLLVGYCLVQSIQVSLYLNLALKQLQEFLDQPKQTVQQHYYPCGQLNLSFRPCQSNWKLPSSRPTTTQHPPSTNE